MKNVIFSLVILSVALYATSNNTTSFASVMAMAKSLPVEDVYLQRAKRVMKLLGVWLPDENNDTISKKIYRWLMIGFQYLFMIFQLIYIIQVRDDMEAISKTLYLLFTQACLCFKVTVFSVNSNVLRNLLQQMNGVTFQPQTDVQTRILNIHANRIKRLLLMFLISSQVTCCLWALKPLFDSSVKEFPFSMWMPLRTDDIIQYITGYAFQFATISMSAYMYFGVDSVVFSMVIFGCAQIDIIKDKIMNIKNLSKEKNDMKKEALSLENRIIITICIRQHQAVIQFTETVENTYHTYLIFQLCGSVGLICMSAFIILAIDWKSMQFFSIAVYLMVMMMQLYVCCWCGHELTVTSEELFVTLYKCPWYEQDLKLQKIISFTMMRMKKFIVFRAGHYVPLSRQTFVTILRMSYSYFALLRQSVNND